jgi:AcrR family transcriptional regulator
MSTATLRQRQAEQVRDAVLDAVITELETRAVDDISMGEVAAAAGISLRTLYRYFPDRAALLQAAGERLYETLGIPYEITTPSQIATSFLDAAQRLARRPSLTRALVQTTAGRTARSATRGRRVTAIESALAPITSALDPGHGQEAVAVIAHLCSAASWVGITDESRLDDEAAQRAVAWAIEALITTLEREQRAARTRVPKA